MLASYIAAGQSYRTVPQLFCARPKTFQKDYVELLIVYFDQSRQQSYKKFYNK